MGKKSLTIALNRLAKDPTYNAYMAVANALDSISPEEAGMPLLKVAVLRNFTLDPVIPVIKGEIALSGFYPMVYSGNYDAIAQDVLDPRSALYEFCPDLVIMAQWLDALSPVLATRFLSLSFEQVNAEIKQVLNTISEFVTVLRQHIDAPVLVNNFPLPSYSTLGILDAQSEGYQANTIIKLNAELLKLLRQTSDVYLVDYMNLMARIGSENGLDERYWQIGRAPIGRNALVPFGQEYGKFFRALHGKARKCLVLDCDNVLWGGIVGEDNLDGIQLGATYPGSCYQAFQHEILNLHDRGVLLALCSKNNEADVLEVLREHPDMVLSEEHFSTWQINWDDKVTSLIRIAQDLNIGLDSLVFVDDSQFECDLVRENLSQVAILELSSEPSTFRNRLSSQGYFDTLVFSAEDRKRNKMYRDETKREQLYVSTGSLDEYLTRLEMTAEIGLADEMTIPRISQLTQKTNQFNVTTRRYNEGEIRAFAEDPNVDVFYIKLRDRIADMGLIGVAIVKYSATRAEIDTFLLSCRAIGRGIEDALMAHVLNSAKTRGCDCVEGCYLPTRKNEQVADFYGRQGFRLLDESDQGPDWELLLEDQVFSGPGWIEVKIIGQEKEACKIAKANSNKC